jgi:hypothetical protein
MVKRRGPGRAVTPREIQDTSFFALVGSNRNSVGRMLGRLRCSDHALSLLDCHDQEKCEGFVGGC